ncbi:MAG: hypothetical protein ACE5I2_10195 [Anaerolineae bacterium]
MDMARVTVQVSFEQLLAAVRQLPRKQKVVVWQTLDAELNREDIFREFAEALEEIRAANEGVTEDEVMADVDAAIREVRAARRAQI